jgi:hypothetical protein
MKRFLRIFLKSLAGLIILILVILFTVPVIFKKQIKTQVESAINGSLNAKVTFSDYKLGFFKNFPNLSFSLQNLYVAGIDKFEGDTLAGFKSFDLVINLRSLFGKSGYEIKAFIINKAIVNGIVLKDGTANWDIVKPSGAPEDTTVSTSGSSLKIVLRKVAINNSTITYADASSGMSASLRDLNFDLGGYLTLTTTGLKLSLKIAETTFSMDGVRYLNKAVINSSIDVLADLKNMKFTLKDNFFSINDLKLNFAGTVEMPKDKIITDVTFGTDKTSFKTLLSLVPAVYMSDYKDLNATGDFSLKGSAKGIYSSADSTLPDVSLNLKVDNGLISYPALPEKISAISINADVFADGKVLDKTTVNLDRFHLELAGSPFDATFFLKTPISDPDFKASLNGKIDLTALTKAVPIDSMNLSGIIDMAITMAGKLSMIEKGQYEKFSAAGKLGIKNMTVAMIGYPEVKIKEAALQFTPAFADLQKAEIIVAGKSDFSLTGQLLNYIPYVFKNETIKGKFVLNSVMVDGSGIMAAMSSGTSEPLQSSAATKAGTTSVKELEKTSSKPPAGNTQVKPAGESASPGTPKEETKKTSPLPAPKGESARATASKGGSGVSAPPTSVITDTASLSVVVVPKNIDFTLDARIGKFTYDNIKTENLKGVITVKEGVLSLKNVSMNMLSGTILISADYDTRDTLKPVMKADLSLKDIGVKDAFTTFIIVQKLAPAAKGIDGKIDARLAYMSLLGSDMMPVINTIDGSGKLHSDQITLVESPVFDKIKGVLKLGDKYSNTFKDIDISFKIKEGRVYVTPFDTKLGNIKMNIGGDQGLDQTLNYLVKTEIPRSDLGSSVNSLIDNISSQAARFGLAIKPSDVLKINVKVSGTFSKPEVSPVFGNGSTGGESVAGESKGTVKQVVGATTDMAKDKLRDEAAAQGDKLIAEAEVKGQQLRDEAAKAAEKVKQEADVQAQNLIKGAESKGLLAKAAAQKAADVLKKEADKRAGQLIVEADNQAKNLVDEAKLKKEEMIKKI